MVCFFLILPNEHRYYEIIFIIKTNWTINKFKQEYKILIKQTKIAILSDLIEKEINDIEQQKQKQKTETKEKKPIQIPDLNEVFNEVKSSMTTTEGEYNDESLESVEKTLISMLIPFMSKDVLYEPINELKQQYPLWLKNNKNVLSQEEYKKRQEQYKIVCQIIEEFDKNDNPPTEKIVDLVQKMGHPPADLAQFLAE